MFSLRLGEKQKMKQKLPLLIFLLLLLAALPAAAAEAEPAAAETVTCRDHGTKYNCAPLPAWSVGEKGTCRPEMRGRCGKRRGDWYGASQPVATAAAARSLLQNYFAGEGYTVSEVSEKRWGFRADVIDSNGKVIDHVMIDKRTGRIRSLN